MMTDGQHNVCCLFFYYNCNELCPLYRDRCTNTTLLQKTRSYICMNIHEEDDVIFWREAGSLLHCFSHNH